MTLEEVTAVATVGTALGTLGLAIATYVLAKQTGREVEQATEQSRAATRQSEAAEAALLAGVRPLLIDVPPRMFERVTGQWSDGRDIRSDPAELIVHAGEFFVHLEVPVRNVGSGVAFIRSASVLHGTIRSELAIAPANVPPGEFAVARLFVGGDNVAAWETVADGATAARDAIRAGMPFEVAFLYEDVGARQREIACLQLGPPESADPYAWCVDVVRHSAPDP